jgi:hypothetical protein
VLLSAAVFFGFRAQGMGLGIGLSFFNPLQIFAFLAFGILLGFGGALVSVGRHLRRV